MATGPKLTQRSVDYRSGSPAVRCSSCAMYEPGHLHDDDPRPHCSLVADPIRPSGVCDRFKAKGG
jgi:LSD1 subclass zinc finger protein